VVVVSTHGLRASLRDRGTEGSLGDRAAFFQVFFAREYDFLLSRVSPGDIVIDAGANVGWFSLLASRLVGPKGLVIAIEPEPSNADCLRTNIALNDVTNVIVIERALDAIPDKTVHIVGTGAMAHVGETGPAVTTITLDNILDGLSINQVGAIKMDIEGAEKLVFGVKSASMTLAVARAVAVEIHDLEGAGVVRSRLRADGYTYVSEVKPESEFLMRSMQEGVRRLDLVLKLYGTDVVAVMGRMLAGAVERRPRSGSDTMGLVYASR